jgi:hypothetical protein
MKKTYPLLIAIILPSLALAGLFGIKRSAHANASTQSPRFAIEASHLMAAEAVADAIPIQGQLTDQDGNPLNGDYHITLRLYDSTDADAVPLCQNDKNVTVENGLFNVTLDGCTSSQLDGRQLYLGIEVETDGEMSPRQPIYAVPYAWSLRPGALIQDTMRGALLNVYNLGSGWGVDVYSAAHDAVHGRTGSSDHAGVSGVSWSNGIGVYGESATGIAVRAAGTGIIQSTAKSYLWISGNTLQKANSTDTTLFVYDLYGGYQIKGGSDWSHNKTVLMPVTIPGQLYGQNITVTGLDLYYQTSDDLTGITVSAMRRQNGVGAGDLIFRDETDYVCQPPQQCVKHWDLTTNNILSDEQGILYIAFQLSFASETAYVQIGGVRLTLEHD